MSDQLLPDFDAPRDDPAPAVPKCPRRSAKKAKRAAPAPKPAKRVPKKRRVRKVGKHPALAMPYGSGEPGDALTHGHMKDLWTALSIFKKYTPAMRNRLFKELSKVLS